MSVESVDGARPQHSANGLRGMPHIRVGGLDVVLESKGGSLRRGVGRDGKPWSARMPCRYGYIRGTEGADDEPVDAFVGPHTSSPKAFVLEQVDADTGEFDEHKVMLGFASAQQATNFYRRAHSDGKGDARLGSITEMPVADVRQWLARHARKANHYASGGRVDAARGGVDDWANFPLAPSAQAKGGGKPFDPDAWLRARSSDGGPDDWSEYPLAAPPFDSSKPYETLPDAPWASRPDAPWIKVQGEQPGWIGTARTALSPVTGVFGEVYDATKQATEEAIGHLNPFSKTRRDALERMAQGERQGFFDTGMTETGKGLLSIAGITGAPFQGAARSLLGRPLSWVMPTATPEEAERLRRAGVSEDMLPGTSAEENYGKAKGMVDTAMMGMAPRGVSPVGIRPTPMTPPPAPSGDFNVPLTLGERTHDLTQWGNESAALRGAFGTPAQRVAQGFEDARTAALDMARSDIARAMDPAGGVIARDAQEAAGIVGDAVRAEAANRRAGYKQLYDEFHAEPGTFDPGTFQNVKTSITQRLENLSDPIFLDEASRIVTPNAHRALDFLERYYGQGHGPVDTAQIDRAGKALVSFFKDARANPADARATRAVLDQFGKHIDDALDAGLFSGNASAVDTWKAARAAYADYRQQFSPRGAGDDVGRMMDKIVGRYGETATPTEVANALFGASAVGERGLSVRLATRLRNTLGEQSPEWSAVKQGTWSKLTEAAEGRADWGPQKVSERIFEFVNGKGRPLAQQLYTPAELDLMERYAAVLKRIVPPPGVVNHSNSANRLVSAVMGQGGTMLARFVGAGLGHLVGVPLGEIGGFVVGGALKNRATAFAARRQAKALAKNFEDFGTTFSRWQTAQDRLAARNAPPTQHAAQIATANLARSLESLGIDPSKLANYTPAANANDFPRHRGGGAVNSPTPEAERLAARFRVLPRDRGNVATPEAERFYGGAQEIAMKVARNIRRGRS